MKNTVLSILLIAFLAALLQLFLPWWSVAIAAFLVSFILPNKSFFAFASGFIAILLLWVGYAFFISSANNNLLALKVTELLKQLTGGNLLGLYLFTGLIGALVGGFAALTGSFAAKLKTTNS